MGRAPAGAPAGVPPAPPSSDPVRALMAEHRGLCEQAVDPLDIAAGLEDAGIADSVAHRYRHADVFGLAEELYARVERRPAEPAAPPAAAPWSGPALRAVGRALLHLPAVAVLAALPWLTAVAGPVGAVPALLPAAGWLALAAPAAGAAERFGYGVGAALLLAAGSTGGVGPAAAVALGTASADLAARRLRRTGLAHLGATATIADFRARMRPLLPLAAAAQLAVVGALTLVLRPSAATPDGAAGWAGQGVLALLFLLAAVVRHGGRPGVAAAGLAACGAVAGLLHLVPAAPGPAAAPWAVAGAVAVAVFAAYAWALLSRPQAYRAVPRRRRGA
jgi:hypothetical protein